MAFGLQWLIDLIVSLIPGGPGYVDRGNPLSFDWTNLTLLTDNAWHDLDVSSIIPEETIAIHLRVTMNTSVVTNRVRFRRDSSIAFPNVADNRMYVAGRTVSEDKIVAVTSSRTIQYRILGSTWTELGITVAGWFGPQP